MSQTSWYQKHFEGKKITVMGLGLLGRGIGDALFLLEQGARLTITDLKTAEDLAPAIKKFSRYEKQITWVLGRHRKKDFERVDAVLYASGVPLDNMYIEHARSKGVPTYMSAAWVLSLLSQESVAVTSIGITGSKGKSTVTGITQSLLEAAGISYHIGGNVRGVANLPLLKKIKEGDVLLMELDSWQLQSFGHLRISPDIALFTNFFPDHMDYYKGSMKHYFRDKANIFRYQKHHCCFVSRQAKLMIRKYGRGNDADRVRSVTKQSLPEEWKFNLIGDHNLRNLALVYQVGKYLEIDEVTIKKGLCGFRGVSGRMEYLGCFDGVHFWNDNNSTMPNSTIASLQSLSEHYGKRLIWWGGGADKNAEYDDLIKAVKRYSKFQILFNGTGTDHIVDGLYEGEYQITETIKQSMQALGIEVRRGDVVLFSPACASFGMFNNEYDRNDQVVRAIKKFNR